MSNDEEKSKIISEIVDMVWEEKLKGIQDNEANILTMLESMCNMADAKEDESLTKQVSLQKATMEYISSGEYRAEVEAIYQDVYQIFAVDDLKYLKMSIDISRKTLQAEKEASVRAAEILNKIASATLGSDSEQAEKPVLH